MVKILLVVLLLLSVFIMAGVNILGAKKKQSKTRSAPGTGKNRNSSNLSNSELQTELAAFLDADTYSDLKETFSKIEESKKARRENEDMRIKLAKQLLQTVIHDLNCLQSAAGEDPVIYMLKDHDNAKLTYNNGKLTLAVKNGSYIKTYEYVDERKGLSSYFAGSDSMFQNNREFREYALQYLLPWEKTLCSIVEERKGSIKRYQAGRLAEAVEQEDREKEKIRELLTAIGFNPDDPDAYNSALKKYDVSGKEE